MRINEKLMKALKFIGAAAAFAVVIPFVSANASAETVGAFEVTGGTQGTDYSYEPGYLGGVLKIKTDKAITIKNTDPNTATDDRIIIAAYIDADITLAGVNIEATLGAALDIEWGDGDVSIMLDDDTTNTLICKKDFYFAGLQKNGTESTLEIKGGPKGTGKLIAKGSNNYGAGIGAGQEGNCSNITISGGIINATGGGHSAGIGGTSPGTCSNITISGGVVNATGGGLSAGIGGKKTENILISGGEVTAIGTQSSAIGQEWTDKNIVISGGSVRAIPGYYQSAISITPTDGNGNNVYLCEIDNPSSEAITIDGKEYPSAHGSDNKIYAYLTNDFHTVKVGNIEKKVAFNGSEFKEIGTAFTISPNTLVYGTDYTYENGVLKILSDNPITIANADPNTSTTDKIITARDIDANITLAGVYISGDYKNIHSSGGVGKITITIADGSDNKIHTSWVAAIAKNGPDGELEIKGGEQGSGKLEAICSNDGAGIGASGGFTCGKITISGGNIIAKGYEAGIGTGENYETTIIITGGNVYAENTASSGSAIGDNRGKSTVIISGGVVTAKGGECGIISGSIIINGGSLSTSSFYSNPTNGSGKNVFLYEIDNPNGADITIDGKAYPSAHGTESKIYAYLSEGETHTIKVGDKITYIRYNNGQFEETTAPTPSKPSRPSRPKPEPVDYPIIGGKETSWSSVAKEISKLSEGEETTIELNGSTTIPADVIKSIKDSKAVVKFKVTSAFSWTVDGSALTDSDIKDIDFDIDLVTPDGTETLRGTVGTAFAIDNITDKATLNISFKENHAGKFANLYKIVDEKLIFIDNVRIDENGEANGLTVYEKGEYTIMLGELSDRSGDMDNDGIVNAKDALAALKHVVGSISGANPLVADINGDGVINAYDALAILKMAVEIAV